MGGNGEVIGKGVEEQITPVITIGFRGQNELMVKGPFHKKEFFISLLADAIKMVASVSTDPNNKSTIITPKPGMNIGG